MTPPEDSDYLDFPANSGSFGGKQNVVQNTTSSVFMSPSVSGDDWWMKNGTKKEKWLLQDSDGKIQETFIGNFNVVKTFFYLCFFYFLHQNCCSHPKKCFSIAERSKWRKTRLFQRPIIIIPFRNKVLLFVNYFFELVKIILHVFCYISAENLTFALRFKFPSLPLNLLKSET